MTGHKVVVMRRHLMTIALSLLTMLVLVAAWPVRDQELVVRITQVADREPVELYNEKIFCTSLPECFRVANKLVVSAARIVTDRIVEAFHLFPGSTVTEVPSWVPQYTRNLAPYLLLRVIVIVAFAFALRIYLRRWWVVALVSNLLLFWSTGVPIRASTRLYEWMLSTVGWTDFYPNLGWHISRNSTIFLLEYDYLALVAVLVFPWILSKGIFQRGVLAPIIFGSALALTFENLAAVFIIGALWSSWRLTKKISVAKPFLIGVGWSLPVAALIVYSRVSNPDAGTPLVAITKLGYSINTEYRPLVYRLLIGFLVLPYVFGVIAEFVLSRLRVTISWNHELRPYINGVILGLCFSYFVGYFHSALATEFGRQSLGGQVLLFLSGFLARQAREERRRQQNISNINSEIKAIS
jgi:hypothetical protein